jgi:hypothetical protein
MDTERITKLVQRTYKNFVPATPLPAVDKFILGRNIRRLNLNLPANADARMRDGWLMADMQIKGEVVRCLQS